MTGAVFGLFTLTFAFSGLLSMEPFAWTNAPDLQIPRDVFTGGPLQLASFPALDRDKWSATAWRAGHQGSRLGRGSRTPVLRRRTRTEQAGPEVKRERLHQPYYITGRAEEQRTLIAADTLDARAAPSARSRWSRAFRQRCPASR